MKNKLSILLLCLLTGNLMSMEKEDKTNQERVSESKENYFDLLPSELKTLVFSYVIGELNVEDFVKALEKAKKEINSLSQINKEFRNLTKLVENKEESSYLGNKIRRQIEERGVKNVSIVFDKDGTSINFYFNGKPYKIYAKSQGQGGPPPSFSEMKDKDFGDLNIIEYFSNEDLELLVQRIKEEFDKLLENDSIRYQITGLLAERNIAYMLQNSYKYYKMKDQKVMVKNIETIAKLLKMKLKK